MAAYEKAVEEAEYSEPEDWMRAAFVAMVEAWEGAAVCHYTIADNEGYEMVLPLPFPQEKPDGE